MCQVAAAVLLAAFAYVAALTQFFDGDSSTRYGVLSIPQFANKAQQLAAMTNIVDFDTVEGRLDGACRRLDLVLPPGARVYLDHMAGPTNRDRAMIHHYVTYYLFPREIATSLDQPSRLTLNGFAGREADSWQELATNGFDVEAAPSWSAINWRPLREDLPIRPPASPDWFPSRRDAVLAFLLPLLTALAGLELFGLLFPSLCALPLLERLASGLALGMMAVAAITLGIKLCGFHGDGVVFLAVSTGAAFALLRHHGAIRAGLAAGLPEAVRSPVVMVAALVFVLVFAAAGVMISVSNAAHWTPPPIGIPRPPIRDHPIPHGVPNLRDYQPSCHPFIGTPSSSPPGSWCRIGRAKRQGRSRLSLDKKSASARTREPATTECLRAPGPGVRVRHEDAFR